MTTIAVEDQILFPGPTDADAGVHARPLGSDRPVDMGLLATLNSRMHCRAPMQRVDPEEVPLGQPVYVDETVPADARARAGAVSECVVTYRCACGFTIDAPALTEHALAS